ISEPEAVPAFSYKAGRNMPVAKFSGFLLSLEKSLCLMIKYLLRKNFSDFAYAGGLFWKN
ncbi:hypothetical protein, partial [Phascolarctobacterium succinatutens]|uniref:hypothetical protein n=1 Tax=Phascolarctobacterium succinatutens TaxID=626940 RepID=UPI004024DEFF